VSIRVLLDFKNIKGNENWYSELLSEVVSAANVVALPWLDAVKKRTALSLHVCYWFCLFDLSEKCASLSIGTCQFNLGPSTL
jgi:hypothetical protein